MHTGKPTLPDEWHDEWIPWGSSRNAANVYRVDAFDTDFTSYTEAAPAIHKVVELIDSLYPHTSTTRSAY